MLSTPIGERLELLRLIPGTGAMQSWQTDLLNLQLTLTVKPLFRYIRSVERLRQMVSLSDNTVGRLSIPRGTRRDPVKIPGADFETEWVKAVDADPERVLLYLPGGAYVIRMPNAHTGMVSRLCKTANARALISRLPGRCAAGLPVVAAAGYRTRQDHYCGRFRRRGPDPVDLARH
jgi:hypothetical protein